MCLLVQSADSLLEVHRVSSSQDLERVARKRLRRAKKKGDGLPAEITVQDELKLVHTLTSKAKARYVCVIRAYSFMNSEYFLRSFDLLRKGSTKLQVR